jgi:hypothetical protein
MNPQAHRARTPARRVSELEEREAMSVPEYEYVLQPNDEALEAGECTGNPASANSAVRDASMSKRIERMANARSRHKGQPHLASRQPAGRSNDHMF